MTRAGSAWHSELSTEDRSPLPAAIIRVQELEATLGGPVRAEGVAMFLVAEREVGRAALALEKPAEGGETGAPVSSQLELVRSTRPDARVAVGDSGAQRVK